MTQNRNVFLKLHDLSEVVYVCVLCVSGKVYLVLSI